MKLSTGLSLKQSQMVRKLGNQLVLRGVERGFSVLATH